MVEGQLSFLKGLSLRWLNAEVECEVILLSVSGTWWGRGLCCVDLKKL